MSLGLKATISREVGRLASRKIYLFSMVLVPVLMTLFFVSLLGPGLPLKIPSAVVDLDHSQMSRTVTRSLNATELIDITQKLESYDEALEVALLPGTAGISLIIMRRGLHKSAIYHSLFILWTSLSVITLHSVLMRIKLMIKEFGKYWKRRS